MKGKKKRYELKCPTCGKKFVAEFSGIEDLPPGFPFCSKRCKLVDLNKWFKGEYRLSTPLPGADVLTESERELFARTLLAEGEADEIDPGDDRK